MFYWFISFGLIWIGFGIDSFIQGDYTDPPNGVLQLALGIAWIVIAVLRRKDILPFYKRRPKPPQPNPYQENLPG